MNGALDHRAEQDTQAAQAGWRRVGTAEAFVPDFYEVRAEFARELSDEEIDRVSGCLGYAFRAALAGEGLSSAEVEISDLTGMVLEWGYDSTKCRRDDPDFAAAFALAKQYIGEGTPVRKTDRAGAGTRGTRLVEGIGPSRVSFWVR